MLPVQAESGGDRGQAQPGLVLYRLRRRRSDLLGSAHDPEVRLRREQGNGRGDRPRLHLPL
jgi:hypothetical protein